MSNSRLRFVLLASLLVVFIVTPWVMAIEKIDLRQATYLIEKVREMRTVSNEVALHDLLGMDADTTLRVLRQISGERGITHTRYIMVYRGVPVWGEQVVVTKDGSGQALIFHGNAIRGIAQDVKSVTPAFDAATALNMMKARQRGRSQDKWCYKNEISNLVIYLDGNKARLCYAVSFFADNENNAPTRPYYFVDAITSKVISNYEGLTFDGNNQKVGEGPGGNGKTGRYEYGAEYPKFSVRFVGGTSTMDTSNVATVNMNHSSSGSTPYSYTGTRNEFTAINGAYCPLNDAHFFGGMVFGMYRDWYNTAPLTFKLTMRVHYRTNYENAFWNGSSMTFGDGKNRFYPLVSLDVSAHEVSHGFTEQNSGLIYSGQSGGINEAFSDIAGEATEYYMKKKNDWMVGAEIFKSNGALRYFADPTKDGRSIGSAKDYQWGMNVHYSSGVYNKAFYLLATTNGWNTQKAFDVFIKANQSYWTPSIDFKQGAQGVVDAANDLGYSSQDVLNAFKGVDVYLP